MFEAFPEWIVLDDVLERMSERPCEHVVQQRRRAHDPRIAGGQPPGSGPEVGQMVDPDAVLEALGFGRAGQIQRVDVAEPHVAQALEVWREGQGARFVIDRDGAVQRIQKPLVRQLSISSTASTPVSAACISPRAWPLASPVASTPSTAVPSLS